MSTLFNMGDYGLYVWSAYGMTFFVFGINVFLMLREKKRINKKLRYESKTKN